jgi:hypothetical protein
MNKTETRNAQGSMGLSAPTIEGHNRVDIPVWDVGDAHRSARFTGVAVFTAAEARSFAIKLLAAAEEATAAR